MKTALALVAAVLALPLASGCVETETRSPEVESRGYIYYLDGAGGGSALVNWGGGVREGLLAAGYPGQCDMFNWGTGLGAIADQDAGVDYKRQKAAELAGLIQTHRKQNPDAPIGLIGLSAGTALTVFTVEALPEDCPVDTVVLLGATIGADHDLTQALRHVRNKLYVFTSQRDVVIGLIVPFTGTADRKPGAAAAGVAGFFLPRDASDETRKLYAERLVTIPWTAEFERDGNYGRHLDNVNKDFIRNHVAPLMMGGTPPAARAAAAP